MRVCRGEDSIPIAPPPGRRFSSTGSFTYRARISTNVASQALCRARQAKDTLQFVNPGGRVAVHGTKGALADDCRVLCKLARYVICPWQGMPHSWFKLAVSVPGQGEASRPQSLRLSAPSNTCEAHAESVFAGVWSRLYSTCATGHLNSTPNCHFPHFQASPLQ